MYENAAVYSFHPREIRLDFYGNFSDCVTALLLYYDPLCLWRDFDKSEATDDSDEQRDIGIGSEDGSFRRGDRAASIEFHV